MTPFLPISSFSTATQDHERDEILQRAEAAVQAAVPFAAGDRDRPVYHYHAPANWLNDPNGTIFYKGWYHLFYQMTPDSADSGIKYWGHARSRDLVHWEELPIALWPSVASGEESIWSGSIFPRGDGTPVAFYTSIGKDREPEQWTAIPEDDDLIRWRKGPVKITQAIHGEHRTKEWRDPFLFADSGHTYLITGGGHNGRGTVNLYEATEPDLSQWKYVGILFTHPDEAIRNIECPNIVRVDGKWVLILSVYGRLDAFVGELHDGKFVSEYRSILDEGSYASQIFAGEKRRAIQIAWGVTLSHKGWNGYLTLPSELHVASDGTLLHTPVKELAKLRGKAVQLPDQELEGVMKLPSGDALEFDMKIEPGDSSRAILSLRGGALTMVYEPKTRRLSLSDRIHPNRDWGGERSVFVPEWAVKKGLDLRVYLDRTTVDVYAGGGSASLTANVEHAESLDNMISVEGGQAGLREMVVYPLASFTP